jgi:glycosyltransferase involved in cell wall biosynthesis
MENKMQSNNKPLVSVLIPVYNCETYLRECMESVLRQTYQNWECIVVNNRSTDRTLAIAEEFAARDPRVRIHNNKEFVRVIRNHNNAFELMSPQSKYCKLVQADDWIYPECVEKMVTLAEANPRVGLVGAYGLFGDSKVAWYGLPYRSTMVSGREIGRRWLVDGQYIFGSPTATMIRADVVRKKTPFWDEGSIHADTESYIEFMQEWDFGFVHQVLTFTRVREGMTSLANRINSYLPSALGCLVRHGAFYLSPTELDQRVRRHLHNYYKFLAKSLFKRMGSDFWRFHRLKLKEFGHPLSSARLSWAVVSLLLDKILNPKQTAEAVIQTIALARNAPPPLDTP